MPNINITELDLTTPGSAAESTDVVYIPGFVDISQPSLYRGGNIGGEYIGIAAGKPTLFTSVAQFVTSCGNTAPTFKEEQPYSRLGNDKFSTESIHGLDIMFKADQPDPGYVMAKELLASGISVLFERVNTSNDPSCMQIDTNFENRDDKSLTEDEKYVKSIIWDNTNKEYKTENEGNSSLFYSDTDDKGNVKYISYNVPTNRGEMYVNPDTKAVYKEFDPDNIFVATATAITIDSMYEYLGTTAYSDTRIDSLVDRGHYSVKYLTSGGYPVYEYDLGSIAAQMLLLAETRGDCIALIDHTDNPKRSISTTDPNSVFAILNKTDGGYANGDFGAMFTPWATYNRVTSDSISGKRVSGQFRAPASFAYLAALADSIKTNANWLAIAGAARGGVRNIADGGMDVIIPNGIADAMQPRDKQTAINAITNINPYGMTIWGNRTLKKNEDNLVATSFLNVRNLISDIKKTCYRAARKATFEQDTDVLWVNFKSEIAKLLERMKSGYGISGYKILRDNDHEKASTKATMCAKIIIYPTYAVEDFYITVVLQDDEVSVD